jgi:glycosyltransferase involved in cell wall biosynthesis
MGGTAGVIKLMLRYLPTAGIEARAVATDTLPSWLPQSMDRIRYIRTMVRFAAYLVRLIRAALWADVVHAIAAAYLSFLLEPLPAVVIGRMLGKRVVLNYHTGEAEDHLRRWHRLVRWAANTADVFAVPSHYLHDIFLRAGIAAVVVPNFIEVPTGVTAAPEGRVVVNTRALEPLYDIPTTLRAFALVQARYPDARLILVASGSDEKRCRQLVAHLGLRRVEFVGGVPHEQVPRYLAQAALFLNSSRIDNQPLSILEAFACGVPVVSTAAGGIADIVRHGETGMLAPIGDHSSLGKYACEVLGDKETAQRLVRAGRAVAAAHAWEALRDMWAKVYGARRPEYGRLAKEGPAPRFDRERVRLRTLVRKVARAGPARTLDRLLQIGRVRRERRLARRPGRIGDLWAGLGDHCAALREVRDAAAEGKSGHAEQLLLDVMRRRAPLLPAVADLDATMSAARSRLNEMTAAIAAADRAVAHRFTLFGSLEVEAGAEINWLREPLTGTVLPLDFWADIDLAGAAVGNLRAVWELNRHQHLLDLARAHCLTGDRRYADEIVAQLRSWLAQNPYLLGPNWTSALEVALRAITWLWVHSLLLSSEALSPRVNAQIVAALRQAGERIAHHLSYTYSPNTHLLGEALGLLYLGAMLPELSEARRWLALGRRLLIQEARRQFLSDGFHFEHATWYHRFATDMYLHALLLCERAGQPLPGSTVARVQKMLECLAALGARDGAVISMGDEDGGQLLPLAHLPSRDFRDTMALGAAVFARSDLKPEGSEPAEAVLWLLGAQALAGYDRLATGAPRVASVTLPALGLAIMRSGGGPRLAFDCGQCADGESAHNHADALSLQMCSAKGPMLVDPGTYTYSGPRRWRHFFRGTSAHNTLLIDGRGQALPNGPFAWQAVGSIRRGQSCSNPGFDFAEGGYRHHCRAGGVRHTRRVLHVKPDYWVVCDIVTGHGEHELEWWFHFPPCDAALDDIGRCVAETPGGPLIIVPLAASAEARMVKGSTDPIQGWVSEAFERKAEAPALCYSLRAHLPAAAAALIAPGADPTVATLTALENPEDSPAAQALAVQWQGRRDCILLAPADRRVRVFGPYASDARAACVREGPSGEVISISLCGGTVLSRRGQPLLNLRRPAEHLHIARNGDSVSVCGAASGATYIGWPARQVTVNGRSAAFERTDNGLTIGSQRTRGRCAVSGAD